MTSSYKYLLILNSSLFGVLVRIFLSDSHYLGPEGFPEFKTSARTFFRLQRLPRTKISSQLFFTGEPSPFESFSKGTDGVLFENILHVVIFEKTRVSFGKSNISYISPRVEYFSKIEDSFGKLHQIC